MSKKIAALIPGAALALGIACIAKWLETLESSAGRPLPAHRRRVLYRHRHSVPALRILPGGQQAHDVGRPDHCFAGHPRGAGLSALGYAAGGHGHRAQRPDRLGAGGRHRHRVLPQNQNGITKQPGGVPKAEASRLRFYKLCAPFGYLSRALWSAPSMVNAAQGPVWVQTTAVSSGASGSAASRASTETVVERESRVVNTRVFTP